MVKTEIDDEARPRAPASRSAAAPRLISLATAVPSFRPEQRDIMRGLLSHFGPAVMDRMASVYDNAGIAQRYSCVPLEWYTTSVSWRERNRLYVENAVTLLSDAAQRCMARAGVRADAIDTLVTVSTTGIATPSLDALLMERLPFRRELERLPIFGLGCAGGVLGLSRAAAIARSTPGSNVLVLIVELCGLTFRSDDHSKSNVVASALFGDGAAAALLRCDARAASPSLVAWGEHTWPHSLDIMGWRIEDDGFGVLFSRDIPMLVREIFRKLSMLFLSAKGSRKPTWTASSATPAAPRSWTPSKPCSVCRRAR